MTSRRWSDDAACARLDARLADYVFFGRDRAGSQTTRVQYARAVCEGCPVLFECLDEALAVPAFFDRHGVRAGLLPAERADLREGSEMTRQEREEAAVVWLGGQAIPQTQRARNRSGPTVTAP